MIAALKKTEQKTEKDDPARYAAFNDRNAPDYRYDPSKNKGKFYKSGLFYFDPNTLSADGWKKLGLREKTIHTIQNYLAKGGHFKNPGDLQKIYGLIPDEYERIAPYIKITSREETNSVKNYTAENKPGEKPFVHNSGYHYSIIDINMADTNAFIALPGIGSRLASRIVNFRDKLGGFYSISQVAETFGLPDSTFQKIKQYLKLENTAVKKININLASVDELKAHPYIRWNLAKPIVAYRNEHGPYESVEDIKKVMAVTEDVYKKILPYLTIANQ